MIPPKGLVLVGAKWTVSLLSLLVVLTLTLTCAVWHDAQQQKQRQQETLQQANRELKQDHGMAVEQSQEQQRLRQLIFSEHAPDVDDDTARDDICRQYLMNFLNGTTDANDECQGLSNAYVAANCREDDDSDSSSFFRKHHRHHHGGPDDDRYDDVLIDDYFEAWKCCDSIDSYYVKHCREDPVLASFKLLTIVGVLVACGLAKSLLRAFRIEWIPDAAACIIVGSVVGGIMRLISPHMASEKLTFNNDLFLHILLPPIVFQSSLTINKSAFRRDLFPILSFAIFGTVFSAVSIGWFTHYATERIKGAATLPLLDSLLFGSLISSIDPVATLGILQSMGVGQTDTLYTLIFGESLLNDGVAIVMFRTLGKHLGNADVVDPATVHECVASFFTVCFASIAIGFGCGFLCTLYFWALKRMHTSVVEVGIFFCWALIPYYISDGMGYSGIISIMMMGFVVDFFVVGGRQSEDDQWMAYMEERRDGVLRDRQRAETTTAGTVASLDHIPNGTSTTSHRGCCNGLCHAIFNLRRAFTGRSHLSSQSRHHVGFVAEVIASIMETGIFSYLGLFLFGENSLWTFWLQSTAILGCVFSRLLVVVLICFVINLFVWLDFENRCGRLCNGNRNAGRGGRRPGHPIHRGSGHEANHDNDDSAGHSIGSTAKVYLTGKTQQLLLLAGVRGAVSFALVESIPIYDKVRQQGSKFKPELKAMTSVSILFTIFVFGGLTYFLLNKEKESLNNSNETNGLLSRRLLSAPLNSFDDGDDDDDDEGSKDAALEEADEQ